MSVIFLKGKMSKKKKKQQKETTIENYYDLKVEQVDDLVAILKDDAAAKNKEVTTDIEEITGEKVNSDKEKNKHFDPYRSDILRKVPTWLKALLVKWWFAGCVCYFIMWGLGEFIPNNENLMLATGAVLGVVVDIFVNPIFFFFERDKGEYNNYMMLPFPFKKFWTFFVNVIYYILVMMLVSMTYTGINLLVQIGDPDNFVGVEPLLFGTICVIIDMAFIGIKDLIVYLVKKRKNKKIEEASPDV